MKLDLKNISLNQKVTLAIVAVLFIGYYFCLPRKLFDTPYATVVADRNNELLGARIADNGQWRFPPSDSVPGKFGKCLIAFEDRYFYYHRGVNPLAVGRALMQNMKEKRIVSGGSTITMQIIRLSRGEKRTVGEKLIEMLLATRLEFRCSKKEILGLYASHAPFGGNVVGLEAASWRYFGHASSHLSWAEAATLAVLPNAPSMLHLSKNRKALVEKRNRLLKKLLDDGTINSSTYELALSEVLPSEPLPLPQIAPHLVADFYKKRKGEQWVSTIDKGLQLRVENLLSTWNEEFSRADIRNMAAMVIDVKTGQVLAYCGNVQFDNKASGNQVDVIRAPRSSGSILKPLLYCAMLQEGEILPNTLLPDIPININGFAPQNFNMQFDGAVPASEALARSLNVPAVWMLRQYSVPKFYDFLKKAGISTLSRPASHYGLALILGGAETTLWDVSSAYCRMAQSAEDFSGSPVSTTFLPDDDKKLNRVFRRGAVWQTFDALKEVNRPEEIDWRAIPSMQKIAWKTGTSYGFRDGWAVGVTPKYVVGVWVGNANGEGKPGLTGARTAGPVMFDIFNLLPGSPWFKIPYDDLTEAEVCRQSGHLKGRHCEEVDSVLICSEGLKTSPCTFHVQVSVTENEKYRVYEDCAGSDGLIQKTWFVLPPAQEWYYKQHHPMYKPLPPFKPGCGGSVIGPMQFIYPQQHATISLPKQLDGSKGAVVFELAHSNPDATVYWHLDNNYVTSTRYFHQLPLTLSLGKHSITAVDDEGNSLSVSVTVE
ncbi:MAG: penicillin-binding protein 1C [Candidatus Azobacteroides sp.]|nr:penicillin-binding protein 1C [Candidatus Azobacteroides sp.]